MKKRLIPFLLAILILSSLCGCKLNREEPVSRNDTSRPEESAGRTVEEILSDMTAVPCDLEENGIRYGKRKNVSAYLFLGIDLAGEAPEKHASYIGGQSDAIFLVVIDDDAKTYTVVQINRDTMTDVEVLDYDGVPTGVKVRQQICLSHTYGDGTEPSCENVVRSVSSLLGGMEISGYFAVSCDAVSLMNDVLGGVSVPIEDDFSKLDASLVLGETVELHGDQAVHFVRGRQNVGDGSNLGRERRQRVYLNAFTERLRERLKENSATIDELYAAAEPYTVTDMTLGELSTLGVKCLDDYGGEIITPNGSWQEIESENGNTYVEYTVDEDALHQLVLRLFYQQIDSIKDRGIRRNEQ